MSDNPQILAQRAAAIRLGGTAGLLGSLSLLTVFIFLAVLVGVETTTVQIEIDRYPEIRTIRIVENTMYLMAILLWTVHAVALFMALRRVAQGVALLGTVAVCVGLFVLAAGAVPHLITDPLADIYHLNGTDAQAQATVLTVWAAVQGIVDALVVTGMLLVSIGLTALSVAMSKSPHFSGWWMWVGLALGLVALAATVQSLFVPGDWVAISVIALIIFQAIMGFRTRQRAAELA